MDKKFVLHSNTSTQRITVTLGEHSSLISKEWRKNKEGSWMTGKGITVPNVELITLGKIVECQDNQQRNTLLSQFEQVIEE